MTMPTTAKKGNGGRYLAGVIAAAVLFPGGMYAAWEATETIDPGGVTAGAMGLTEEHSSWEWADGSDFDPKTEHIVPGDTVIYREAVRLTVTSPGMAGTLTTTMEDVLAETINDTELADAIVQAATFEVDGITYDGGARPITHDDHGAVLATALTVTFPTHVTGGMGQTVELGDIHVVLRQGADTGDKIDNAWGQFQIARSEYYELEQLRYDLSYIESYPGTIDDATLRESLAVIDLGLDHDVVQAALEDAGLLDLTITQAQARIDQDQVAAKTRQDTALDAMHATGDSLTARWITQTAFSRDATVSSGDSETRLGISPVADATAWELSDLEYPFSVEWDPASLQVPGVEVDGDLLLFTTPEEPGGTFTFSWTLNEHSRAGDLIASTPITYDVTIVQASDGGDGVIYDSDGMQYWHPYFSGGNFVEEDFWASDLNFTYTYWDDATMPVYVDGLDFSGASMLRTDFSNTLDWNGANFAGADLTDAFHDDGLITAEFLDSVGATWDGDTILN